VFELWRHRGCIIAQRARKSETAGADRSETQGRKNGFLGKRGGGRATTWLAVKTVSGRGSWWRRRNIFRGSFRFGLGDALQRDVIKSRDEWNWREQSPRLFLQRTLLWRWEKTECIIWKRHCWSSKKGGANRRDPEFGRFPPPARQLSSRRFIRACRETKRANEELLSATEKTKIKETKQRRKAGWFRPAAVVRINKPHSRTTREGLWRVFCFGAKRPFQAERFWRKQEIAAKIRKFPKNTEALRASGRLQWRQRELPYDQSTLGCERTRSR